MAEAQTTDAQFAKKIDEAWRLRYRGLNAEVESLLAELGRQKVAEGSPELRWQVEILHASLERARRDLPASNARLERLGREILAERPRAPHQFYLQKATNLYVADEFSPALEFFLLAESTAGRAKERLVCLANILACLDNLNLPIETTLARMRALMEESSTKSEDPEPIARYLRAFDERQAFRHGRFAQLFAPSGEQATKDDEILDQGQFLRLYASRLPYVKARFLGKEGILQKLALSTGFYTKNFRLKTILADKRIRDCEENVAVREQVDRLYLWTWLWLEEQSESARENLADCLRAFPFATAGTKMTFEDFQLLRNALSWIAIFQDSLSAPIDRYLEKFTVKDCEPFPLFEYEYLLTKCWHSEPEAERRRKAHPLRNSRDLRLNSIFDELRNRYLAEPTSTRTKSRLLVNEETDELKTLGKTVVSTPMAQILIALADRNTLTFAQALWIGFEIAPYDQQIHAPKVQNCLARIKVLLPRGLTIQTKEGRIYLRGRAESLQVLRPEALRRPLPGAEFAFSSRPSEGRSSSRRAFTRPLHPRHVVERARGKQNFNREQLQEIMGASKASTVRWLERWLAQGLIKRHGTGRSTTYLIDIIDNYRLNPNA